MKRRLVPIYEFFKHKLKVVRRTLSAPKLPVNPDGKVYVNVGCGNDSGKEFTNVDVLKFPNIHHVHDITELVMFGSNTVDLVYASHVVEHLPKKKLIPTLKEWKRVLKPGGVFRFSVPNFDALVDMYHASGNDVFKVRDQVLGQEPPYNNHYTLWNLEAAKKILAEAGFVNPRIWSPETADHHDFKDRSSRVIEAGGKNFLLSLNIEAEKPR